MAKSKDTKNQKVIIINNMFTGGYGLNGENLPHEMINFFRDKNNNYNVYITPTGTINSSIKEDDIRAIIFIRNYENGMVEVLGKAENIQPKQFYTQGINLDKQNQIKDSAGKTATEIKTYLTNINDSIFYGKKSLTEIHTSNTSDNGILVSMRVNKFCLPKKTFYLSYKPENDKLFNDVYFLPSDDGKSQGKQIANQSMLAYYYETDNKFAYNKLIEILEDAKNEFWENESETPKYDAEKIDKDIVGFDNFFKITRQQDNEVMFSNMFFYYFSTYPDLLKYFAKELFKIELSEKYIVQREKERMDIRIIDDNNYIIIENKIKSGINGIIKKQKGRNDDKDKNTKIKYEYNDDGFAIDKNGKYISQLSIYIDKARKYLEKNNTHETKIHAYIFAPNYSPLNKTLLDNKYSCGNSYSIVRYKDIEKVLAEYTGVKPPYFQDFLYALNKHTKTIDDEHRLNLLYRLKCRIEDK